MHIKNNALKISFKSSYLIKDYSYGLNNERDGFNCVQYVNNLAEFNAFHDYVLEKFNKETAELEKRKKILEGRYHFEINDKPESTEEIRILCKNLY